MSRKLEKDRHGYLLIGVIVIILIAFLIFRATLIAPSGCPDDCCGIISQSSVILLDHTDAITQQTKSEIESRALAHVESLPENSRVTVFAVTEQSKTDLKPRFNRCIPPQFVSPLTGDPKQVQKNYNAKFRTPLVESLRLQIRKSNQSPLAQAMTDISLSQYLRAPVNHLLVFSDMLENTSTFSLYSCTSSQQAAIDYRKARKGAEERPRFVNTDIMLNLIPRYDLPEGALRCRDGFWNWFFGDNSGPAAVIRSEYLPGGDTR